MPEINLPTKVTQDAIKKAVDNVNTTLTTVNTNVSSVKTDVSTVNANVNTVKSQTASIQSAISGLSSASLFNGSQRITLPVTGYEESYVHFLASGKLLIPRIQIQTGQNRATIYLDGTIYGTSQGSDIVLEDVIVKNSIRIASNGTSWVFVQNYIMF